MIINKKPTTNLSSIANAFNTYFSTAADNLITKSFLEENTTNEKNPLYITFNKTLLGPFFP